MDTHDTPAHDTPENDTPEHGRRLVLVDIENLLGGSHASSVAVERSLHRLHAALGTGARDVVKIACGPTLLIEAMSVLGNNVLLGRGVDGADRRLVDVIDDEPLDLFASVALASGDAVAFTEPVRRLAAKGLPTDLYIGRGALGTSLRLVARSVTCLDRDDEVRPPAAAVA